MKSVILRAYCVYRQNYIYMIYAVIKLFAYRVKSRDNFLSSLKLLKSILYIIPATRVLQKKRYCDE